MVTKRLQHVGSPGGIGFVQFEIEMGCQSEFGDTAVEKERVAVWDEEGGMRLVIEHGGIHLLLLLLGDIGRIGDHNLKSYRLPVCVCEGRRLAEDVALGKSDGGVVALGITAGDGESFLGDVEPIDVPVGVLLLEGNGYAAGACTDVQHCRTGYAGVPACFWLSVEC